MFLAGCGGGDKNDNSNGSGNGAGAPDLPPTIDIWVDITTMNQGNTASEICISMGYLEATEAKRCPSAGGNIIKINEPYSSPLCPLAKTYGECFDFYPCGTPTPSSGVIWESIHCVGL